MLKILIPLTLIPLLSTPHTWRSLPKLLLFLTLTSTKLHPPFIHPSTYNYIFSLDHLSAPLITLTLWVTALMVPISLLTLNYSHTPTSLPLLTSLLAPILVTTFALNNLLLFYLLFETSLVPTILLILLWGYQPDRLMASFYMMMYTISASLPLLLGTIMLLNQNNQLHIFSLTLTSPSNMNPQLWWVLMILAFLVKIPLYSLHLWLPKAHVEAPTAGSMILASILLKLGGYGLIRLSNLFPPLTSPTTPFFLSISLLGACLTGLICVRQTDLKALIAYSSVAHMGLMIAGIMSMTMWGWAGALSMMLAHGLSSPALFSLSGVLYETTNTRSLFLTKGFLTLIPSMTMWWFIASATNMAAPPFLNLMSEILILSAILSKSMSLIPLIITCTFLAAAYSLHLYTSTQHGPSPSFLNPTLPPPLTHHTSLYLHLSPLFLLMLKAEIVTTWT